MSVHGSYRWENGIRVGCGVKHCKGNICTPRAPAPNHYIDSFEKKMNQVVPKELSFSERRRIQNFENGKKMQEADVRKYQQIKKIQADFS